VFLFGKSAESNVVRDWANADGAVLIISFTMLSRRDSGRAFPDCF